MLELRHAVQRTTPDHDLQHRPVGEGITLPPVAEGWEPPIARTVAVTGEGIADLGAALDRHRDFLDGSGERRRREVARARAGFVALLRERLLAGGLALLEAEMGHLDEVAARIADRQADPYRLAAEMAARLHR
jgi:LAO/AO transport system kinase